MPIVDERGRVLGRVNLIDAIVAFLILVMIPVAFGAYLLFRTPQPVLMAVRPNKVRQGPNLRVEVTGENLRPFMRVSFNQQQGRTYMIASTRSALVDLPDLESGVYDVVLYDHMQEVSKLSQSLTVLPLAPVPTVNVRVDGAFKALGVDRLKSVKTGDKFLNAGVVVAEVQSIGQGIPSSITVKFGPTSLHVPLAGQVDVPAVLRLQCFVTGGPDGTPKCSVPGPLQQIDVIPGAMLSLAAPDGWVNFQIDKVMTDN